MAAVSLGGRGKAVQILSFPRLTGLAVVPIARYFGSVDSMGPQDDETIFLAGMMLCHAFADNQEHNLPEDWYDMIFVGSQSDPVECLKAYLRGKGVETSLDQLLESAAAKGYITYQYPPIPGTFSLTQKFIDEIQFTGTEVEDWTLISKIMFVGEVIAGTLQDQTGPFTWNTVIFSLVNRLKGASVSDNSVVVNYVQQVEQNVLNNLDEYVDDLVGTVRNDD